MITGIVVALSEEIVTLTSKPIEKGRCVFIRDKILVARAGMGPVNADAAAELLIAKGASQLISWGCAAALAPSLRPGDLLFADRLLAADNKEFTVDAGWFEHTKNLLAGALSNQRKHGAFCVGMLTQSASLIGSANAKRQAHVLTAALGLDMESCAVAKVARQHGLPFLAIRAIADPAGMGLPGAVVHATNADGEVALGKLLSHLSRHPAQLPDLIKLGIYFNKAKRTLKRAAGQLESIADFACRPAGRQDS